VLAVILAGVVLTAVIAVLKLKKPAKMKNFESQVTTIDGIEIPEGTRIVALGEAAHGNKEFQELKLEVFQQLVEKTNVRALILEGDLGGCAIANKYIQGGEGTAEEATLHLGYTLYKTDEMCKLVQWMHDYNETAAEHTAAKGGDTMDLASIQATSMFPVGGENVNYAQYFDGKSYLNMISTEQVVIGNVTFEPGCRNHWHIHHADKGGGQMLLVTAGRGWYQEWGKPAQELKAGDVVHIPANVKHWHGAAKDSAFQHLAIEVPGENTSSEWCEPVEEKEYNKLP
jgi:quercetin dioxygenase-like cupin family protein